MQNRSQSNVCPVAIVMAVAFAMMSLWGWAEHEKLDQLCRLTGDHEEVFGEDVRTKREAIDSICTRMPTGPNEGD